MKHSKNFLKSILLVSAATTVFVQGCTKKPAAAKDLAPVQTTVSGQAKEELPNPMKEADSVLDFESIGVHMVLPKEALSPSYHIINGEVADVEFTYDQVQYTYRASDTAQDFAGIFERFKDGIITETAGSGEEKTQIQVRTTESGGHLASWEWGSTKYTLYTPGQAEDADVTALAVTLAGLSENQR